jgi:hypothetical protein
MADLRRIADAAAACQGVPPLGRPFCRRKAGILQWIAANWEAAEAVVTLGKIHLSLKRQPGNKNPLVISVHPPRAKGGRWAMYWTPDQMVDDDEEPYE